LSDRTLSDSGDEAAALRAELARVRDEAGKALKHLRSELDALRASQDSVRDVDSVTEQIAMQQELDTIRRTLQEKERLVDNAAEQCRRLEDELEDQHIAYDGLKQDLERKQLSLNAAHEQAERVSRERQEIEERYQSLLSSGGETVTSSHAADQPHKPRPRTAVRFIGALAAGVLLAALAFAAWMLLDPFSEPDTGTAAGPDGETIVASAPEQVSDEPGPVPDEPDGPANEAQAGTEEASLPVVLGTVRDQLSNGSEGPSMLMLRGGEFTMGKARALPGDDAGPARKVSLEGFLIGATEVTFEEYDRFARASGRRLPDDFGWGRGQRPVVDVSWADARAYARWLTERTGKNYRLPSEAEWEYAAGAGRTSAFWWGYQAGRGRAVCFDCGSRWDKRSSAPVASFAPNPFGLYDTAGNVMEWVDDCYHPDYVGAPLNGQSRGGGDCSFRVARGGAFNKPARSMRTTTRHHYAPGTRINHLGFRLARDE
jgi:formylglycine-generating enzyme required for sulfatase activity